MRSGLTFAGAQCGFQFPAQTLGFLLQALVFLLQPLLLLTQSLQFLLCPIQLPFRNELATFRRIVCGGPDNWFHPTLR